MNDKKNQNSLGNRLRSNYYQIGLNIETGKGLRQLLAVFIAIAVFAASVIVLPATDVNALGIAKKKSKVKKVTAEMTMLSKDNKAYDFRVAAGEKLYGYDTLQGACANKGYAYLTLYNRNVEKCKIVKIKLADCEVVKVSEPLPIYHANCLTYNTKKNLLLATCCRVKGKRAVFIDPATLTVKTYKDIKLTKRVKKLPKSVLKKYKGFTAITYNSSKNCYIGRLRGNNNVIIFDGNLKPKKYVKLSGKKTGLLNQGMDSIGNYIYDVRSFKGKYKYNMVTVHTMTGKLVGQIKVPFGSNPGNELQCIFHDGGKFYAGIYRTTSQIHDLQSYHVFRTNRLYKINNMIH